MKKILYVHHGSNQGGAPRSLSFLLQKLDRDQYEPYVLCISDERNIEFFENCGAKVIFEPHIKPFHGSTVSGMNWKLFGKNILGVFPSWKYMKKIISEVQPDIIHLNSTCLFTLAAACKKAFLQIPIICHVREPLLPGFFGDILRHYNRKYVDHFIAIEQYDADSICVADTPVDVIYNFVDFEIYSKNNKSNVLREELGLSQKEFVVLYLARFAPSNGTLEIVKTFSEHKDNLMHLVLVGDKASDCSAYTSEVRRIAQSTDNIHIMGFRQDVADLIAGCDIVVCPFTTPHFARTVIEAGAMCKCAVVSDVGGLEELVVDRKTGLVFPHDDFEKAYEACLHLKENPQKCAQYSDGAYQYSRQNFEASENARRTFAIYESVKVKNS